MACKTQSCRLPILLGVNKALDFLFAMFAFIKNLNFSSSKKTMLFCKSCMRFGKFILKLCQFNFVLVIYFGSSLFL